MIITIKTLKNTGCHRIKNQLKIKANLIKVKLVICLLAQIKQAK